MNIPQLMSESNSDETEENELIYIEKLFPSVIPKTCKRLDQI